jgi:radical SAM superfamily enzyme YgiQ (UPF0313 family)
MKPVEQVVEEIKAFEKYNHEVVTKRYHFVDDNLYVNREYTMKLFSAIKDLKINWMGMGSLNIAGDEEVLKLMAESGCRSFLIGYESISEASLQEANKTKANRVTEYKNAANNMIKYGILPGGYFIFGFDSDDEDIFRRTVEYTQTYHIINPYFNILTPFPGTELYERVKSRIFDKQWSHYGSLKCLFKPEGLSPEQVEEGSYWASKQVARLDVIKEQLAYFWSQGPWKSNPRLKFKERMMLRMAGLRLRYNKEYKDFLFWAARQKNAVDMFQSISAVTFYDMSQKFIIQREKEEQQAQIPLKHIDTVAMVGK